MTVMFVGCTVRIGPCALFYCVTKTKEDLTEVKKKTYHNDHDVFYCINITHCNTNKVSFNII